MFRIASAGYTINILMATFHFRIGIQHLHFDWVVEMQIQILVIKFARGRHADIAARRDRFLSTRWCRGEQTPQKHNRRNHAVKITAKAPIFQCKCNLQLHIGSEPRAGSYFGTQYALSCLPGAAEALGGLN